MGLNLVIFGTILALVTLLLYAVRKWDTAEIEKATLAKTKVAQGKKLEMLEQARLQEEARVRELEKNEADKYRDNFERGDIFLKLRKDPDDLN